MLDPPSNAQSGFSIKYKGVKKMDEKKILLCRSGNISVISDKNIAKAFLGIARACFGDEKVLVVNIWGLDESQVAQICVWYGRHETHNTDVFVGFIKPRIVDYTDSEWWDKMPRLYGLRGDEK